MKCKEKDIKRKRFNQDVFFSPLSKLNECGLYKNPTVLHMYSWLCLQYCSLIEYKPIWQFPFRKLIPFFTPPDELQPCEWLVKVPTVVIMKRKFKSQIRFEKVLVTGYSITLLTGWLFRYDSLPIQWISTGIRGIITNTVHYRGPVNTANGDALLGGDSDSGKGKYFLSVTTTTVTTRCYSERYVRTGIK